MSHKAPIALLALESTSDQEWTALVDDFEDMAEREILTLLQVLDTEDPLIVTMLQPTAAQLVLRLASLALSEIYIRMLRRKEDRENGYA